MDRTDAAWSHAEPTPRWRSLLDRARLTGRGGEDREDDYEASYPTPPVAPPRRAIEPQYGLPQGDGRGNPYPPPAYGSPPGYPPPSAGRAAPPPPLPLPGPGPSPYSGGTYGHPAPPQPAPPHSAPPHSAPPHPPAGGVYGRPADPHRGGPPNGYQPAPPGGRSGAAAPPAPPQQERRGHGDQFGGRMEWQPAQSTPNGVEQLIQSLRKDLGNPKVIAFANPKGGVHKTTATVLAAATIGGVRGRGVIAWDDNELRGTLGLRAGSARHARTIRHLVQNLTEIEASHGEEMLARLDDFLRHASDGSYDVLAGEENPRFAQRLEPYTVRRVLELLRRTHEVICVDTGNNVESPNWQTILQMADQLVITTVPREDAAFTADWMIDLLHETGLGDLAANAVTLLSCPTPNPSSLLGDLAAHFATRTRAVAVVPYDPMLETGSSIEHTQLAPVTRRAWLQAAAVFLEPFGR